MATLFTPACPPAPSHPQGNDTPIYSVLRSSSSVKMKVKEQAPTKRVVKSQTDLAGQESTSHFT